MTSTDLETLLADWACRQRLSVAEAETIRETIVTEPATTPLPATWWRDFALRMSDRIVRTTRPRTPTFGSTAGCDTTATSHGPHSDMSSGTSPV